MMMILYSMLMGIRKLELSTVYTMYYYPGDEFSTVSEEESQFSVWLLLSVPGSSVSSQTRSELCQWEVSGLQLWGLRGQSQEDGDSLALHLRPPAASTWSRELRHSPQPRAPGQPLLQLKMSFSPKCCFLICSFKILSLTREDLQIPQVSRLFSCLFLWWLSNTTLDVAL